MQNIYIRTEYTINISWSFHLVTHWFHQVFLNHRCQDFALRSSIYYNLGSTHQVFILLTANIFIPPNLSHPHFRSFFSCGKRSIDMQPWGSHRVFKDILQGHQRSFSAPQWRIPSIEVVYRGSSAIRLRYSVIRHRQLSAIRFPPKARKYFEPHHRTQSDLWPRAGHLNQVLKLSDFINSTPRTTAFSNDLGEMIFFLRKPSTILLIYIDMFPKRETCDERRC